jgi:hypothetical protein
VSLVTIWVSPAIAATNTIASDFTCPES